MASQESALKYVKSRRTSRRWNPERSLANYLEWVSNQIASWWLTLIKQRVVHARSANCPIKAFAKNWPGNADLPKSINTHLTSRRCYCNSISLQNWVSVKRGFYATHLCRPAAELERVYFTTPISEIHSLSNRNYRILSIHFLQTAVTYSVGPPPFQITGCCFPKLFSTTQDTLTFCRLI